MAPGLSALERLTVPRVRPDQTPQEGPPREEVALALF